jgi:protein-tyrosine phosphatase
VDLDWDGCINVRDLGGFPTRTEPTASRVYVRADNARNLTARGWRAAADYGIRTVLDLRSDGECAADPPPQAGFDHYRISLFDHYDGDEAYRADLLQRVADLDDAERYQLLYREALELDAGRLVQALDVLANADGAILFHCVGGKDRTGLLTALVLRLVGVSLDDIEDDYMQTERRAQLAGRELTHRFLSPRGAITEVIGDLEARHGAVETYLRHIGLSTDAIDRIRRKLAPG